MKKFLMSVILFITPAGTLAGQSLVSSFYCKILGNADAKKEYQELTRSALQAHGIAHSEDVPVKKMNKIGSFIAGTQVSSFTAFGIWLDEKSLDSCSQEERIFQIHHEAAHYAQRHHPKLVTLSALAGATLVSNLLLLKKSLSAPLTKPMWQTAGFAACVAGLAATFFALFPRVVRYQEKEADVIAAQKLVALNKASVVRAHIDALQQTTAMDNHGRWWYSAREQVNYLKDVIKREI